MQQSSLSALLCSILLVVFVAQLLLTNFAEGQSGRDFGCSKAYCSAYGNCPEMSCRGKNKVLLRNVTECGCCHRCVEEKPQGEGCPLDITGNLPGSQCAPHLKCTPKPSPNGGYSRDGTCEPSKFNHAINLLKVYQNLLLLIFLNNFFF